MYRLLETSIPEEEQVLRIQAFSYEMLQNIDERIRPHVKSDKLAFRVTADHGPAIMVLSAYSDESDSLVSLGDAANYPAKRLSQIDSRILSVNTGALSISRNRKWEDFYIDQLASIVKVAANREDLGYFINEALANQNRIMAASFIPKPTNGVQDPLLYRGYVLRADLDGFTARVKKAMSGTDEDKQQLANEFTIIMQYPSQFKDKIHRHAQVMLFPWAGDCANMLLVPSNYGLARTYLPNRAGIDWHDLRATSTSNGQRWSDILSDTQWVAGIAGGDDNNSNHGFTLVGRVIAYSRQYLVGGGWGWGRSQDAIQADLFKPEDTVIHIEDYRGLSSQYQKAYSPEGIYYKASLAKLKSCEGKITEMLAEHKPHSIHTNGKTVQAPAPRPYAYYDQAI
jgi:hypothetical protein